jgi:hypothetical protein
MISRFGGLNDINRYQRRLVSLSLSTALAADQLIRARAAVLVDTSTMISSLLSPTNAVQSEIP